MKKSKERIEAEKVCDMSFKKRWENFWYYNKLTIGIVAFVVILVGMFIHDIVTRVEPDYTIGIVTDKYFLPDQLLEIEKRVEAVGKDVDGNGSVDVDVMLYQLSKDENSPIDPNTQMANNARLIGDIDGVQSAIFLSDDPEFYQEVMQLFSYKDGSQIEENFVPTADEMGVDMLDTQIFSDMGGMGFDDFKVCLRVTPHESMIRKEKVRLHYYEAVELYHKIVGDING